MLETDARDRVIVALDCDRERALELAHELSGHAAWLKVGMTLYYAEGPEIVKTFKDLGFKVFLDLKFHDIPHQVRGAARSASLAGADLLSVHGLGSGTMLAACREGAEEAREDRAKLVAITVLTSMNQDALSEIGVESPVAEEAAPQAPAFEVILASNSPRRRDLLTEAGVNFTVRTPVTPVDESLEPDLAANPEEAAKKLAERKAGAVIQEVLSENYTGMLIVIGADTMVVLDGKIFGKPRSASDGKHMLRSLSGRTHEVITAVSVWMVAAPNAEDVSLGFRTFADISRVTFRDLTDEEITDYLRKGESFDKAGAYAIQGEGASLVDHYDGSLDTIIGLPATRLIKEFPDLVNAEAAEC